MLNHATDLSLDYIFQVESSKNVDLSDNNRFANKMKTLKESVSKMKIDENVSGSIVASSLRKNNGHVVIPKRQTSPHNQFITKYEQQIKNCQYTANVMRHLRILCQQMTDNSNS